MKNILIATIIGLVVALIIVVLIKMNSPLGIVMKQGFKQLNRITLIDKEKVKELETELKTIKLERDSIFKIYDNILKENKALYLTLDKQQNINFQLNSDLATQRAKVRELTISQQLLTPTQNTLLFDDLTSNSTNEKSLLDGNYVKTRVERIIEANYKMQREEELETENVIQQQLIENLELTNNSLKRINSNSENALVQCNTALDLTIEEKNQYKDLYLESAGKTRKGLFITTGIIVIETIVLVWVLTK